MYAQTSLQTRTNDRFLTQTGDPRAFGPGAEATWEALEVDFATKLISPEQHASRGYKTVLRAIARASLFALAGTASGLLVFAIVSYFGAADASHVLAGLMFATAWLFVGIAVVVEHWTVTTANLALAAALFVLAFTGMPLAVAALVSVTGLTISLGTVLPSPVRQ